MEQHTPTLTSATATSETAVTAAGHDEFLTDEERWARMRDYDWGGPDVAEDVDIDHVGPHGSAPVLAGVDESALLGTASVPKPMQKPMQKRHQP